jgi:hypothetical protein
MKLDDLFYHLSLCEGGWMTTKTQGTVISPAIVKQSLSILEQFFYDFNKFLKGKGITDEARVGAPTGSSAYHDVDPEDKVYGDVDVQIVVPPTNPPMTLSQLQAHWNELANEFVKTVRPEYVDLETSKRGHPILALHGGGFVQVDFMWHEEQNASWGRYRATPERGLKGLLYGNLFSILGDMLDMSIQYAGVQYKTVGDEIVPFSKHKDTTLNTLSNSPETFLMDIFEALWSKYSHEGDVKKIDPLLKNNPGVSTDSVQAKVLVDGIKGLARSFEKSDLFGQGPLRRYGSAEEFLETFLHLYTEKAEKEIGNKKRDSAETPDAVERAEADRNKIRAGLKQVRSYF